MLRNRGKVWAILPTQTSARMLPFPGEVMVSKAQRNVEPEAQQQSSLTTAELASTFLPALMLYRLPWSPGQRQESLPHSFAYPPHNTGPEPSAS